MERSILITGGLGFIGSNLVPKLLSRGMKVRILDNFSAGNTTFTPGPEVKVIKGDIRNRDDVARSLSGIECVIHLAASGSVVESIVDPEKNFAVNVNGTLNLLQGCVSDSVNRNYAGRLIVTHLLNHMVFILSPCDLLIYMDLIVHIKKEPQLFF